jgi:TrmH family RNA methyltransferase
LISFRTVHSKQNARLKDLRQAMHHPGRKQDGGVGIEGPNLLAEALRAGLSPATVFVAEGFEHLAAELPLPDATECLLLPRALLNTALATEAPQPIAALVEPPAWNWEEILGGDQRAEIRDQRSETRNQKPESRDQGANSSGHPPLIVILAGLQDPGNVGTILRSAEAFGATGLLTLPGTVSPWNQKALRASAGSIFRLPILATTADEAFARLRAAGVRIYTTAVQGAEEAHKAALGRATALLIGNEGNGVPPEIAARADAAITIPCPGPVESLNAAVAASILLYQAAAARGFAPYGSASRSQGVTR